MKVEERDGLVENVVEEILIRVGSDNDDKSMYVPEMSGLLCQWKVGLENLSPTWKESKHNSVCDVMCQLVVQSQQLKARNYNPQYAFCNRHYRFLYQYTTSGNARLPNLGISSHITIQISGFNCSEPEVFQRHLQDYTDFEGSISAHDKDLHWSIWSTCYR